MDYSFVLLESTTSTNDEVLRLARSGEYALDKPLVVMSARQTAGRGRLGRAWESPSGGVYLSVLVADPCEVRAVQAAREMPRTGETQDAQGVLEGERLLSLSPLIALAVRDALQETTNEKLTIKWPNDVFTPNGKLAGILIERKQGFTIMGIGINVNRPIASCQGSCQGDVKSDNIFSENVVTFYVPLTTAPSAPQTVVEGAGYLSDRTSSAEFSLEDIATMVVERLLDQYGQWLAAGCSFAPFAARYESHLGLLGGQVTVSTAQGERLALGTAVGVDEMGRLLVDAEGCVTAHFAGEVTLR